MQCENIENENSAVRDVFGANPHTERLDFAREQFLCAWRNALVSGEILNVSNEIISILCAMERLVSDSERAKNTTRFVTEAEPEIRKKSAAGNIPWRVLP